MKVEPGKLVVLTASIGERAGARIFTPRIDRRPDGVRYLCFSDKPIKSAFWERVEVERVPDLDGCRDAKRYKIRARDVIGDATASIWIDRHCRLLIDPVVLFSRFSADVAVCRHWRNCIYREGRAVIAKRKDAAELVRPMLERFRLEQWPEAAGLFFGGFIARRHTDAEDRFSRLWLDYVENGSRRDQLSLPVALSRSGVSHRVFKHWRTFFKIGAK